MTHCKPFPKLLIWLIALYLFACESDTPPFINTAADGGNTQTGTDTRETDVPLAGQMNIGGEIMGGEATSGAVVSGEMVGGEMVGGETDAGEILGGETNAGEMMGGIMNDEPISQIGDRLEFDSTVTMNTSTIHRFRVDQELGVHLRITGQNGEACPEGADSLLLLYRTEGLGRVLVSSNDDYMSPEHFCSEIITTIPAGEYQAEVSGYNGQTIENYKLSIAFYPALMSDGLCDLDSLNAGICPQGYLCIANQCTLVRPQLDIANATKSDEMVYIHIEGSDADLDAAYMNLSLIDDLGNELAIDDLGETILYTYIPEEAAPINTGLADFNFDFITALPNLELASEISIEIEDALGNLSDALIIPLNPHPILIEGDGCLINGMNGLCTQGLSCRLNEQGVDGSCQTSAPPSITEATISSRTEDLVLKAVGQDPDQNIIGLGVTLYNAEGQAIFGMGGVNRELVQTMYQVTSDEVNEAYYVTLEGAFVTNTVAAEIALIDSTGLESQVLLVQLTDLPQRMIDMDCDIQGLQNQCTEGICYPTESTNNSENRFIGICRADLPQRGEYCDYELGCTEGFVCFGPENNSNLSERFQTCMRACDANAEIDGCVQDELCLPDIDWASLGNTEIASPGVCLISDQCISGNESNLCPEADSTCLRVVNITLCVDLSSIPNEQRSGLGESCTGINQPCDQGLLCELGSCRQACDDTNLCAVGQSCRVFDEIYYDEPNTEYAACMEICDPVSQTCEEGFSCTVFQSESSQGRLSICLDEASGDLGDGEACTLEPDDNYWGNCSANHFCTRIFRGDSNECHPICTTDNISACTGQRTCIFDLLDTPDVGLCTGQCEFFTGQGCQAQETCWIGAQGLNAEQETIISGVCIDNPNRGEQATGNPCVYDQLTNTSNCQAAHLCVDLDQDSTDECVALCQAGNPEHGCSAGSSCINVLPDGSYLFDEDLSTLGLCVPTLFP